MILLFFPALTPSSLAGLNMACASSTRFGLVPPEVPGSPAAFPRGCRVPIRAAHSVLWLAGGACWRQPVHGVGWLNPC